MNTLRNRYFAINGREFPDTIQDNGSALLPNQPYGALVRLQPNSAADNRPALIRMINVGAVNHPFHPHGNHTRQIAQDGRLVASTEHFGETIGSGQTEDFLLRWDDADNWNPTTNPLPVAQPNYRNLFFKDGNTWYSGSPYLGYKGTLPVGTTSQNACGEWYFPLHSHALNEFTNFDQGFGGMGTLLRVDPAGGCFGSPTSSSLIGGTLKSGSVAALGQSDDVYYQINPKTTTRPTATTAGQLSVTVASAAGFPSTGQYYVRIDNEILLVTGGQGTTTWTVSRGQLGTAAASHLSGAVVTALATDWYAAFGGVPAGSTNLKVIYEGRNCGVTTLTTCPAVTTNLPQQTVKICNWTIAGAAGCSTATSAGWTTLPAPPTQPQAVGSTDVSSTWTLPGPASAYIGTGSYAGPAPGARPHPAVHRPRPDDVLDLGRPDEDRVRRAMTGHEWQRRAAMRTSVHRGARVLLVFVLAVFGLTCVGGAASAATVAIELCAVPGTAPLPGGGTVPIWGFGTPTTPGNCATATASLPGPRLEVTQGDLVTITVRNALPAGHVVSFEIPGVTFNPGPTDAAPGTAVSRTFTAQPGTYLYQSGGDAGRQEAMGLSGALLVRTTTANQAYASATTAYDVEAVLVLMAVDPAFNAAPETFDLQNFRATYWLVNGTAYPAIPAITAAAGQRVLLRYLNAGYDNTSCHRAGAVEADERHDGSGPARDDRAADVDPVAGEPRCGRPAGLVVGALADEPRVAAQLADPGGDVRGLAAGPELGHRIRVRALSEGLREADDHVEQQVAEGDDHE